MSDSTILTLRLPQSLLDRADALTEVLAQDEEAVLLGRISRSIVLRLAVLRGLEQLESQYGIATKANSSQASKSARSKGAKPRR